MSTRTRWANSIADYPCPECGAKWHGLTGARIRETSDAAREMRGIGGHLAHVPLAGGT